MATVAEVDETEWTGEFAPWDGRRVPVTLLGGYLGAGKTTVLNELLLATDRPIAVLVNDVGAVNIDAALVKRRHGDTIELTDGCVCCSLTQGLADAFAGIRSREAPPDQVLIELSGVADPRRVLPWADSTGFALDAVVVLVDVDQYAAWDDDEVIGPTVRTQVGAADLVVLTKTDLVDAARKQEVTSRVQTLYPDVQLADPGGPDAAAALLRLGGRRPGGVADVPAPTLFDPHQTERRPIPDPIDRAGVEAMLDQLPTSTVRAKGVARTPNGGALLIQLVGRRRSVTPLPPAESQPPTDLVVITAPGPSRS